MNPRRHQKHHSAQSSRLHSMDAGMVQYLKIHQCNILYKQTQRKKHMMISLDVAKVFNKSQLPFMLKGLEISGIQSAHLNIIKGIYIKEIVNIKLSGEKLESVPVKSGTRQDCQLFFYLFNSTWSSS